MERAQALDTFKEVAAEVLSVDPDQVTETARFKEDLDADSLDLVELVMGLEERFDIEVPEEDLEGVTTVGQAVDLVLAKVGCVSRPTAVGHRGRVGSRSPGIGVKTPAGSDLDTFWSTLCAGTIDRRADRALRPVPPARALRVRSAATSTRRRISARRKRGASTG